MSSTQGRLTGLDGLRAIAVTAVFLFHADFMWARGGYLGVDLFFVISGFLITSLLIAEGEAKGRINLGSFYWRRAKRLLPASYMVMTAATVAAFVWAPDALPRLRWDALASLFYVTNWELLYHGGSYFETMGRQPLLLHLWSLAIEEQFYLIWAPIVFLALPRLGRGPLIALAGAGAVVSAAWMASLGAEIGYPGEGDPTRLYFGTDTHGFPLMIGAFFGLIWRPNRGAVRPFLIGTVAAWALGLTALAASLWFMSTMGEETAWLYPWGFLASAAASATLILCATYRGAGFGDWLDTQPMRWIGERSYGIYLWHWPIFMLTRPGLDLDLDESSVFVLRVALTLVIAALSYRYVEQPIRNGLIDRIAADLGSPLKRAGARWRGALVALAAGGALATSATIFALTPGQFVPEDTAAEEDSETVEVAGLADPAGVAVLPPVPDAPPDVPPENPPGPTPDGGTPPVVVPGPSEPAPPPAEVETFSGKQVTAIGDSVMLGSKWTLDKMLPGTTMHAEVGWQAVTILKQLKSLSEQGLLTDVVVVHVGTNGYVTEDQLNQILALLSDRKRVVLVNVHAPRRWIEPNNELFARTIPNYPNVSLADWRTIAEGHNDWFAKDGVHPKPVGQRAYVAEIMRAGNLANPPPDKGAVTAHKP